MSWEKLVGLLKDAAPAIAGAAGTVAGGPAVGAILASVARRVTGKGDSASLDDLASEILADPDKLLAFRSEAIRVQADLQKSFRVQDSADLATVAGTMQAESKSEHWAQWGWRPYWGFASGTAFMFVAALVCYLGYKAVIGGNTEAMRMIPEFITSMALLFGIPMTILGVASHHRGREKRIRAGESA